MAAAYWPERVEALTGVPQAQLIEAARLLGDARTAMILTARGAEQQSHGVDNVLAFINVALALGAVGKPFSGYGTITGQGNGQGGREHGQKADQLARLSAHRRSGGAPRMSRRCGAFRKAIFPGPASPRTS